MKGVISLIIYRKLTLMMIIITLVVCFSSLDSCNAREGKGLRHIISSAKSYGKSNHHGNAGKGKKHTPPPHPLPPPPPPPLPIQPPPSPPPLPIQPPPPPLVAPAPTIPPSPATAPTPYPSNKVFNVLDFGAKGDGTTYDTKAFQEAWVNACKTEASTIMIPAKYVFLVGPISFSGPYCQHNIVFQVEGKLIAPTNPKVWGSGILQWLDFSKLVGITIRGSGTIDGNGAVWWQNALYEDPPPDSETQLLVPLNNTVYEYEYDRHPSIPEMEMESLGYKMPSIKPTALRFYGSFNVTVAGINIQNSPQCHLKFDNCIGVSVYNLTVSSPGNSPNTDGIHLQNSKDVLIRSSNLACGDDCVSIQTGCTNVYIHDVYCGPGHGISIGGLGKDNTKACVSNITVRNVIMNNTMYGVRIKTWQGGLGSVEEVLFSNIQVSEVQFPIIIDQFYCDKKTCKNETSAVGLSGIHYQQIRGTYTVKALHLACSDSRPCIEVTLSGIELKAVQEQYHMYDPYCWQTYGQLYSPTTPPVLCIQDGKPSSTPAGDDDSC